MSMSPSLNEKLQTEDFHVYSHKVIFCFGRLFIYFVFVHRYVALVVTYIMIVGVVINRSFDEMSLRNGIYAEIGVSDHRNIYYMSNVLVI